MNEEELKVLRRLDRAYACYAYVGLFTIALVAVATVPVSTPDGREGYGMALVLPGTFLPVAFVIAIVLSVKLRSYKPVRLLGLSTLFLALVLLALFALAASISDRYADNMEYVMDVVVGMYGCVAILVPAWWFVAGRRRFRKALDSDPQ